VANFFGRIDVIELKFISGSALPALPAEQR
jgi:hypothetical protein